MKQETKKRWIEDLRSGKYRQCQNDMSDHNGGYCCLGVLAYKTLGVDEHDSADENEEYNSFIHEKFEHDEESTYSKGRMWGHLAAMNDGLGSFYDNPRTFTQIADWIEENVPVD